MPSYVSINNSATYSFGVIPNPTGYSGYTNQPADFTLASKAQDTSGSGALDITPWTMFQKSAVSVGSITPANYASAFHFYSGPNAGQGSIHVVAYYGGVARTMDIPVQVYAQPTPTTSTTTSPTPTTTSSPPSSTSPPPSTQSSSGSTAPTTTTSSSTATNTPPPSIATDSPIRSCIIAKITQARFDAINSGQSRPTPAEFDAMQQCFATQNFEVPNNFSTVPPSKTIIKAKPVAHDVTVAAAATVTTKVKGAAVEALKFTGKAKPNSTVLLYLFSEPIVITTSSNADGEWSYSLQDPMAPGKHEAYALVDKGTGDYERSSVFDFAIAKASAVSSNPNGYSLKIEPNVGTATANNNATVLYVGGIAGLIGIVLAILAFVFVRKQKKNSTMSMPESSDIAPIAPQIAAVPPAENVNPVIPTAPETPAEIVTPTEPTDTSGPTV